MDHRVLFDDGKITGVAEQVTEDHADVRILMASPQGTRLRAEMEINVPDTDLAVPVATSADEPLLEAMQSPTVGVMIARGDPAVEGGYPKLAELQEEILWLCEAAHQRRSSRSFADGCFRCVGCGSPRARSHVPSLYGTSGRVTPAGWEDGEMTLLDPDGVTDLFLACARVVATAVAEEEVGAAWDRPSILSGQNVGGVAGHLARGGVWVVGDYLDGPEPVGPVQFETAGAYFAMLASTMTEEEHRTVRERGASVAAAGQAEVVTTLSTRLELLEQRIQTLPVDHLISVISGKVMRLSDYLVTRIVEQTVHLDDLARSLESLPWSMPEAATALTIAVGGEIGSRRHGTTAMIRALYRSGFAESVFPVL